MKKTINLLIVLFFCFNLINIKVQCEEDITTSPEDGCIESLSLSSDDDEYEFNDGIDFAYPLISDEKYSLDQYSSSITANIITSNLSTDIDFFYFSVISDSNINIYFDILNNSNALNIHLYEYIYDETNGEIERNINCIYNDSSDSLEKTYIGQLNAGTYLIHISSNGLTDEYTVTEYSLITSFDKIDYSPQNIGDLKTNKGMSGAIWVSDYVPFNILDFEDGMIVYDEMSSKLYYPEYILNDLNRLYGQNPIPLAAFYLWDYDIIVECSNLFSSFKVELENYVYDYNAEYIRVEKQYNEINKTLNLICCLYDSLSLVTEVPLSFTDIAIKTIPVLDAILKALMLDEKVDFSSALEYVTMLNTTLSSIQFMFDNGGFIQFPVIIPICYRLERCNDTLNEKYELKYEIDSSNYLVNSNNAIYYDQQLSYDTFDFGLLYQSLYGDVISRGKYYALYEDDFSYDLSSMSLVDDCEDIIPSVKPVIVLSTPYEVGNILMGEYKWYEFTAPHSGEYDVLVTYSDIDAGEFQRYVSSYIRTEVFNDLVTGFSSEQAVSTHNGYFVHPNDSNITGCYFKIQLLEDQKIYFRVSGVEFKYIHGSSLTIFDYTYYEEPTHTYEWYSPTHHRLTCLCCDRRIEPHSTSLGSNTCILCNGPVSGGFIEINNINNEQQTYIVPSFDYLIKKEGDEYEEEV